MEGVEREPGEAPQPERLTFVVGTYGDESWRELALSRAGASCYQQSICCPVVLSHGKTLSEARNAGAERVDTEWVVFVDADDAVDPLFAAGILCPREPLGDSEMRTPSVIQISPDRSRGEPFLHEPKPLRTGNWLIIATAVRTELFHAAGGFREWPIYEDWDLWWRCTTLGGVAVHAPEARYLWFVNERGRNLQPTAVQRSTWHAIRHANGVTSSVQKGRRVAPRV